MVKEIKRSKKKTIGKQKYGYNGYDEEDPEEIKSDYAQLERADLEERIADNRRWRAEEAERQRNRRNRELLTSGGVDTVYRRKHLKKVVHKKGLTLWPKRSKTGRVLYLAKKPKRTIGKQKYRYNGLDEQERYRKIKEREQRGAWLNPDQQESVDTYDTMQKERPEMKGPERVDESNYIYERRNKRKRVHKKGLTLWPRKTKKKRNIVW